MVKNSGSRIASGTVTDFDAAESKDYGVQLNLANGEVKIQKEGIYQVAVSAYGVSCNNDFAIIDINVNGSRKKEAYAYMKDSFSTLSASFLIRLQRNDVISLYNVYAKCIGVINFAPIYFSGQMLF